MTIHTSSVVNGFGCTVSRLAEVFGVSRQTLYNWLSGETPREQHQAKLYELAAAAQVFKELGFRPNNAALDRTVSQGKSFIHLLRTGADGAESARLLVRLVQRGAQSKCKLDAILEGRRSVGRPHGKDQGSRLRTQARP